MKKEILLLISACLISPSLWAQTCQKVDIITLISRAPKPMANAADALKNSKMGDFPTTDDLYQPFVTEMRDLADKTQQPNPVTLRKQQEAANMEEKFKKDGVDQMTDEQKLAYAKQQNLGGMQGNIDFAQKMKDPAFRKKFEAMSPQEKMALMQQQGMMKQGPPQQSTNPMQADMQTMMQDPVMREKWAKMSPAERQAFIENYKKSKGYNEANRPAQQGQNQGSLMDGFGDEPTTTTKAASPIGDALAQSRNFSNAMQELLVLSQKAMKQLDTDVEQANNAEKIALDASFKKQAEEGLAQAKSKGDNGKDWLLTNPQVDHAIRLQFHDKRVSSANTALTSLMTEWNNRQAQLKTLATTYQAAMTKISFGESLYADDSQFQNLATLAGQQASIFVSFGDMSDAFNQVANKAAAALANQNAEKQVIPGKRELVRDGS